MKLSVFTRFWPNWSNYLKIEWQFPLFVLWKYTSKLYHKICVQNKQHHLNFVWILWFIFWVIQWSNAPQHIIFEKQEIIQSVLGSLVLRPFLTIIFAAFYCYLSLSYLFISIVSVFVIFLDVFCQIHDGLPCIFILCIILTKSLFSIISSLAAKLLHLHTDTFQNIFLVCNCKYLWIYIKIFE